MTNPSEPVDRKKAIQLLAQAKSGNEVLTALDFLEARIPEYLTVAELVERWRGQVSSSTLANWRSERKGPPFVKIGARVLYPLADVIAYETQLRRNHG